MVALTNEYSTAGSTTRRGDAKAVKVSSPLYCLAEGHQMISIIFSGDYRIVAN